MARIHARVIWTLIFLCTLCSVDGAWAGPPTDHLREGVDRVGKILKDPALAGANRAEERRVAISRAVDKIFDFSETAKRALGQYWAPRTPPEREEFVRLFTDLFERTYVSKVDQFNSEMTYRGETVEGDHAVVRTTLLLGKGGEISMVSLGVVFAARGGGYAAHSLTVETSAAYAARLAGDLRDAGLGGERRRAVLGTAGAR